MADNDKSLESFAVDYALVSDGSGGDELVIKPTYTTDLYTTREVKKAAEDLLLVHDDVNVLRLDLTESDFIDATTLGMIVGFAKNMRQRSGEVKVSAVNDNVLKIFKISGLDGVFEISQAPYVFTDPTESFKRYDPNDPVVRTRIVMRQLGILAKEIEGGLKTYEQQLSNYRSRHP